MRSLTQAQPTFLRFIAPAGFGKSTVVRQYGANFERVATCDCLGITGAFDLAKRLTYAVTETAENVDASMLQALALGEDVPGWSAFCRRAWERADSPHLLIVENGEALYDDVASRSVLIDLLSRPNPGHRVALCSRVSFSLRTGRFATPNETVTLGPPDLRFDRIEIACALQRSSDDPLVGRIEALTEGWPMAVFLLQRLLERGKPFVLKDAENSGDLDALYDYLAEQILESLEPLPRRLLSILVFLPKPTLTDLERLTKSSDRKALLQEIGAMAPFVTVQGEELLVHPLIRASLRDRSGDEKAQLLVPVAEAARAFGDMVRAAEIFLEAGDQHAAGKALSYGGLFLETPSPAAADMMTRLDPDVLMRHPTLWNASTVARAYHIPPAQWIREGETVWRNLTGREPLKVRLGVVFSLANAYANDGRFDDVMALCDDFEATLRDAELEFGKVGAEFWRVTSRAYMGLETMESCRRAIATIGPDALLSALIHYDCDARWYRLNGERANERAALERGLQEAFGTRLPLLVALISIDAAFGAWLAGEDELFERYLTILEEHSPASVVNGSRLFLDAARGRLDNLRQGHEKVKTRAYAYVVAATKAKGREEARALAMQGVAAGDHSGQPFARVLARVALSALDPQRRSMLLDEARTIAAPVVSQRFRADLDRIVAGRCHGTMWEPTLLRLASIGRASPGLMVRLLDACVEDADGRSLKLTAREFEVVAFLALGSRAYTTEELVDAIWQESPETGRSSLKVFISRIRRKLGDPALLELSPRGYRLFNARVDVAEMADLVRRLRPTLKQPEWNEAEIATLVAWLRRLRTGFPAVVAQWSWFTPIEGSCERQIYETALTASQEALQRSRFNLALELATELITNDPSDDLANEIAVRARTGAAKPARHAGAGEA